MRRVFSFEAPIVRAVRSARAGIALPWMAMAIAACARGGTLAPSSDGGGGDARAAIAFDLGSPSPICRRYLGCVARGDDGAQRFAEIVLAYGEGSSCWSGDASIAVDCSAACREGALALPRCGECDEDDACGPGLACVDRRCAMPGCRIDVRRADALVAAACACSADCAAEASFVRALARASADADCAEAFAAWVGCESTSLRCREGHVDLYGVCEGELARLTTCENRGISLRCP
jgi:hypothetical protein